MAYLKRFEIDTKKIPPKRRYFFHWYIPKSLNIKTMIRGEQKRKQEMRLQELLLEGIRSESSVLTSEKWERLKTEILEEARR